MNSHLFRSRSARLAACVLLFTSTLIAQKAAPTNAVPVATLVQIVRAEDERRWDNTLETLLTSPSAAVRKRAALAAGRIGDEASVPMLTALLEKDADLEVRNMAAFALGETESAKAADVIHKTLTNEKENEDVRARAIEAAGKIAAANKPTAEKLGDAILDVLDAEAAKTKQHRQLVLLGLTAVLRVRPAEGDYVAAKFLTNVDARVRMDAGNTLSRLRAKNANETFQALLMSDNDAVVRANAARALGAAEDKTAYSLLLEAAVSDEDSRVRVSAVRSLAALKDKSAVDKLIELGNMLLGDYKKTKVGKPAAKNELLEIATALGRLLPNASHLEATRFLETFRALDKFESPETEIALSRINRDTYIMTFNNADKGFNNWRVVSAYAQGLGDIGNSLDAEQRLRAGEKFRAYVEELETQVKPAYQNELMKAMPDVITAMAALKPDNLSEILRNVMGDDDIYTRAAIAGALADLPYSKENFEALKSAFIRSLLKDKEANDAQLAIMDALFKLNKKESAGTLLGALVSGDQLVRAKAYGLLKNPELEKDLPGLPSMLDAYEKENRNRVKPYLPIYPTKLGQVLNTNTDYTRAVSRKNGSVKAVFTTEKGAFTIDLLPDDAPLTVDNFVRLARANYFNGVSVHRVVANFVMQDGDPRGDGNGGPGWTIRCEMNMVEFGRGAVGMALSGKDTGGSQWFAAHSPQPHLDGGYTVFGQVNETDMKVVDNIARGDKIISVRIVEGGSVPAKARKK